MPNQPQPAKKPRYSRGADLSKVPKAADTPPADLSRILAVDTANPYLRQVRIQQGLLKESDVDPTMLKRVPLVVDDKLQPQIVTQGETK
jgi:hypothetical protein